jgi:hypothetical protein
MSMLWERDQVYVGTAQDKEPKRGEGVMRQGLTRQKKGDQDSLVGMVKFNVIGDSCRK